MSKIIALANGQQIALDNIDVNIPGNLIDAFSRLRVSNPVIQVSLNQSSQLRNLTLTEGQVSGTNTSATFNQARASTTLTVGNTTGSRRLRSTISGLYQPGKSLLILFTFVLGTGTPNVKKRIGYFDPSDGIFLEQNGTTLSWVKRSSVSGAIIETTINQANWNTDKFDGIGEGYNFDATKCHIGFISIEWLGVGNVACGFIYNQKPIVAHSFSHPNLVNSVYMRTANLFLTYEIERTAAGGSTNESLEAICGSIINEGNIDQSGAAFAINRQSIYSTSTANLIKPILLFRLNPSFVNSRIIPVSAEIAISTGTNFYIYLLKNPTYSVPLIPTWTSLANTSLQYDRLPNTTPSVTNVPDSVVWAGLGTNAQNIGGGVANLINYLGSNFNGVPDEWCLAVQCDSINETVNLAVVKFLEMI